MKRVVDNSPAKRREMLWNSTVRGGVRSGDAPFLARFSNLCVVRGVAHSSRTRACVAEPRACRDVKIRFRLSPERPCILTASAGAWSATCRFRCASRRSQATRSAAQCSGEREYAIVGRRGKTRSFGRRFRPTWRACPVRTRACERGQREPPCGYPITETTRDTVHFDGECQYPIGRRALSRKDCRPVAPFAACIRHRIGGCACMWISCVADHSKRCGFQR